MTSNIVVLHFTQTSKSRKNVGGPCNCQRFCTTCQTLKVYQRSVWDDN